jgi:TPR repeat protein
MGDKEDWSKEPDVDGLYRAVAAFQADPKEGEAQLRALAEKGSALSMVKLGHMYAHRSPDMGGPDSESAERWYRSALHAGSQIATYNLGSFYLRQKDYVQAQEVFELGTEMGYGPSAFNLGRMYLFGLGVDKDYDRAFALYQRAAALGNLWGKLSVATMTVTLGKGMPRKIKGLLMLVVAATQFRIQKWQDPKSERLTK